MQTKRFPLLATLIALIALVAPHALHAQHEKPDNSALLAVGTEAPDFSLPTVDGEATIALSDYQGRYLVIDFWASWCGPCRREIAHLKKVRDAYTDKGLVILGAVVWDKMEDHLQAVKDLEITWPQIFNDKDATDLYGIAGIPQLILFDPSGKIVARDLRGELVNAQLDEILKTTGGKL